ncbi:uncharacterized protein GGS22DRAFT_92630 [Annulohypoxylon maeteangense]|uniref:uncharacterized protein n=1 Tax=Annulohypoxylon maeteangense TaxID=1927788 RepID=UPI002007E2DA|nr:uncharacterized protein GGS22DRAFT_92630 [Annulohypoxylon maeteangense]KAI0888036.1 hypothetical protein GGS22DRAFT_92630 [Annulohypoxylon maeteangense]
MAYMSVYNDANKKMSRQVRSRRVIITAGCIFFPPYFNMIIFDLMVIMLRSLGMGACLAMALPWIGSGKWIVS